MDEMELLAGFRDEVPANVVPAQAERLLSEAIRATQPSGAAPSAERTARRWVVPGRGWGLRGDPGWHRPRPVTRLAVAGALTAAVAAGAFAATTGDPGHNGAGLAVRGPGGPHAGVAVRGPGGSPGGLSVRELAYQSAAAAAARPPVRPGQWVYWKEQQFAAKPGPIFQVWTTADSREAAYVDRGKLHLLAGPFIGQPEPQPVPAAYGGGVALGSEGGLMPVSYSRLRALPSSPRALVGYLGRLPLHGWGPAPAREFQVIYDLLTSYVMPPGLTAELYRALADIPGVTADPHAVDLAGRAGVAFRFVGPSSVGGTEEIILNSRTFQVMGTELIIYPPGKPSGEVLNGMSILREARVSGPGERP